MATTKGRADVHRFMGALPGQLNKLLRGAGKAGAEVIADEARSLVTSPEVREKITTAVRVRDGKVDARIEVRMGGFNLALWLEDGTSEHFISVAANQRQGRSIGRINRLRKEGKDGVLVINGKFVGDTVHHPGARPHPFLRPALDLKIDAAIATGQAFVNARVSAKGVDAPDISEDVG